MTRQSNNLQRIEFDIPEDVLANRDAYLNESPLYLATHAIVQQFVKQLTPGSTVLEIGCGAWDFCKNLCQEAGAVWYGLDPLLSEKNKDVVATHRGSVHAIPLADNSVDYVIGNQTIEHWHEFGVAFDEALCEIWRVLKPGGVVVLNAPIYLHGHSIFLLNDQEAIARLFEQASWEVHFEHWTLRGSEPYLGWKRSRFSAEVFPQLRDKSSFVLNIIAKKKDERPKRKSNRIIQAFTRSALKLCRISKASRLAVYHLHYGPAHYLQKFTSGLRKIFKN